jgi:hypothetical protein
MFKVGDRVKIARPYDDSWDGDCQGFSRDIGKYGYVTEVEDEHINVDGSTCYHANQLDLVPVKGKRGRPRIKPKPVKFLLKYDLDEDPIEEFSTMDEVRERIDYLVKNESSLKKDSMIVYEVKSRKTVSVQTKIKLSK